MKDWIKKHDLTKETAGKLVGKTSRMINYYCSGSKPIPTSVIGTMHILDLMLAQTEKQMVKEALKKYRSKYRTEITNR